MEGVDAVTLRTRKPTGLPPWPIILVEGAEKSGKSTTAYSLSASERIGRSVLFEIGERTGDAYARLGDYEMAELDGSWSVFIDQYSEATIPEGDLPGLNIVDSGTVLWESLKDWIGDRAAQSKANRKLLQDDPDAAITIGNNLWNDANGRWGKFMRLTKAHPGVTVITARSKITAKIGAGGAPIVGQTEYKIEAQKDLPNHVSAIVRCEGPKRCRLVAVADLDVQIPSGGLMLPEDNPLEHLVFDLLGAGGFGQQVGSDPVYRRAAQEAKNDLVALFTTAGWPDDEAKTTAAAVWADGPCPNASKADEVSDPDWAALTDAGLQLINPEPVPVSDGGTQT
jgi:hypothetical protein